MLSRRDAVYARALSAFSRCGIVNTGYIYRVRLNGTPQYHDLNWIGPMQLALFEEKYATKLPEKIRAFLDWTEDLVERCCGNYWSGAKSEAPVWEALASSLTVLEILSDRPITVGATRGGWPAATQGRG